MISKGCSLTGLFGSLIRQGLCRSQSVAGTRKAYKAGISAISMPLLAMLTLLGTMRPGGCLRNRTEPLHHRERRVRASDSCPANAAYKPDLVAILGLLGGQTLAETAENL